MKKASIKIIRGGRVLNPKTGKQDRADILVIGDTIADIGPPDLPAPSEAELFDASEKAVVPGLVNGHIHGHGTLAKGLVEDRWPLELFLNALPGLSGSRTLEDKYLNGLVCAVELIRKGCTACYDLFFEFPQPSLEGIEAIGRAYKDAGIRALIAPMVADTTLYNAYPGLLEALPDGLRERAAAIRLAPEAQSAAALEEIYNKWPFDRTSVRPAIAPTIPLHCSDQFLVRCKDLAADYGLPLQTHLAETKAQAILGQRRYGSTLVSHLNQLGILGPGFSAAHAIWLDRDDLLQIADNGASVIHAPMSNMRFGSGLAHLRPMLDLNINIGIATDAANSSDSLNMFEATRLASYISRVQTQDYSRWLGSDEVFQMATVGSAQAMGWGAELGQIAKGHKADLVFIDLRHINYVPLHNLLTQIVFTENGAAVDSVMIGGQLVLDHGRMTTVDETKLRRDANAAAARLASSNEVSRALSKQLQPYVGAFCSSLSNAHYHVDRLATKSH
ncbi:MAG: amidohydrolase family protein [Hyphomicrobiales bacterium]